jgi:CheY-like chemotaxis protein
VPIIFLTARDATEDKLRRLTSGGDDYMTKPFSLEELVARIRVDPAPHGRAAADSSRLVFEDLELDEDTREVHAGGEPRRADRDGVPAARSSCSNPAAVLTRAQILDHVWELRLRRRRARAGDLHVLPAQEARRPRARRHPHRARVGYACARHATSGERCRCGRGSSRCCSRSAPVGLVVLAAVTYATQRSFLLERVDEQAAALARTLDRPGDFDGFPGGGRFGGAAVAAGRARVRAAPGHLLRAPRRLGRGRRLPRVISVGGTSLSPPDLPAQLRPGQRLTVAAEGARGSSTGSGRRVAVQRRPDGGGGPAHGVDATLDQLLRVEALVIAAVLILLAILSALLVGIGLRPLERIGATADAIAAVTCRAGSTSPRSAPRWVA